MKTLHRIAARLFDVPLLVLPAVAETIAVALEDRLEGGLLLPIEPMKAFSDSDEDNDGTQGDDRPYDVADGVAVIPIQGELVNRGSWLNSISGLTSYEAISGAVQAAAADPNVTGILLDVDSPGGEAAGAMETGALIRAVSKQKPVVSFVNGFGTSAAYALAAGANRIFAAPSATLGSIGVVLVHRDRSQAMAKAGIKATLIHAGAHKVDGSDLQPLDADARARIQSYVDQTYQLFVDHVVQMRGLEPDAVRANQGGLRIGAAAVEDGLADEVSSMDGAFAYLNRGRMKAPLLPTGALMTTEDSQAQANVQSAVRAAVDAERKRTSAIIGAPEAKGREALANYFAYETEMTAEAAIAAMAKAPEAAAASRIDPSEVRHNVQPNAGDKPPANGAAAWDQIAAALNEETARNIGMKVADLRH